MIRETEILKKSDKMIFNFKFIGKVFSSWRRENNRTNPIVPKKVS